MGARFDDKIDANNNTRMKLGTIGNPALSGNNADTVANELRTHLVVTGTADTGKGMFSFGDLLGSGMASDEGERFVDVAVKAVQKVEADVSALLALDTKPANLEGAGGILDGQWTKIETALTNFFGASPVRTSAPREEDILDEIADILDALSSEDSLVEATSANGGGVFASQALGAGAARNAFNRLMWSAEATLGRTGSTRYGTAVRKVSANAKKAATVGEYGAFSYSTMEETVRTQNAAAVSLTGIASYSGGTHAVNTSGKVYSGTMELQVRFTANSVSGVVSGLQDSDGLAWQHNFADVDRIVLDDGTLRRNAKWTHTGTAGSTATVFYTRDSGLLRPVSGITNTFDGILLGQDADAGSEANGTWSIGESGAGYLAGAFGVEHVADATRPMPPVGDVSTAGATLFSMVADTGANMTTASIADGTLTVKARAYGYRDHNSDGTFDYGWLAETYGAAGDGTDDTKPTLITAKFDLAAMAGAGEETKIDGPTWVEQVMATLTAERDLLSALQSLNSDDTQSAEMSAWQRVQRSLQNEMLGNLPAKMADAYGDLESEADAIGLINRALGALSSNSNLAAALDPDGTGIFDHYPIDLNANGNSLETNVDGISESTVGLDLNGDGDTNDTVDNVNERTAGVFVAANGKVNGRAVGQMRSELTHQVIAKLGTTSYTRFGAWRRQSTRSAVQTAATGEEAVITSHGGPGTFAYSPLDPTMAGSATNPAFPVGGSASFEGEAVAFMNADTLTGTARVEVSWASATTTIPLDLLVSANGTTDVASHAGTMSLTIGNLADSTGDPLTYFVSGTSSGAGQEIAEIVFDGMNIEVGLPGARSGQLIVGAETAGTPTGTGDSAVTPFTCAEIGLTPADDVRYRLAEIGMSDEPGTGNAGDANVAALFVGRGVDGPLGVIGTFTLNDANVARVDEEGTGVEGGTDIIYGAFGADIP